MQKQQVFKVKGMQRDLSMANANGEFAYEIINMRLLPTEENAGLSLTNEQGALLLEGLSYNGIVIGQCPTNDSLVFFTHDETVEKNSDYIYKLKETNSEWELITLFNGNLNFNYLEEWEYTEKINAIEALFNYETEDIQKVYWVDGHNQLRCINIVESPANWGMEYDENTQNWKAGNNINNDYFDSVKEISTLPNVEIERVSGGNFVTGVLQYYITYFNEFGTESPIVYTSPLLYLAHSNRGANVNDSVSTAFKLILNSLDTTNWGYIRIYSTHRTSLDATPEGAIVTEIKIPEEGIEFIDYGTNRISIAPSDLYFTGSKFVKAGTMTVKDQVMFLGNLDIQTAGTVDYTAIKDLFDGLRISGQIDSFFSTETRKQIANDLVEYQDTYYTYNSQLNNTESITHYKYGEKYRFGISVMDKYGVWSNPIWIKDEFILTPPEQINGETLELPCPTLNLSGVLENDNTLWEELQSYGAVSIKPLVVFPKEEERKVIAQGVVCPTVYNLKDRKENGPYAQASWFMRPNAPVDLWGIDSSNFGQSNTLLAKYKNDGDTSISEFTHSISHKSDVINFPTGYISTYLGAGYYGAASNTVLSNKMTGYNYLYDDFSAIKISESGDSDNWDSKVRQYHTLNFPATVSNLKNEIDFKQQEEVYKKGSWVEFRHNYALRSKGWSFGAPTLSNPWMFPFFTPDNTDGKAQGINYGMVRGAELDVSRFDMIPPTNRFVKKINKTTEDPIKFTEDDVKTDNLYFVTLLSPKEFHNTQRNGKQPSMQVLYKYTTDNDVTYIQHVSTIKFPKEKKLSENGDYYVRTSSPWEFINIPETILPGSQGNDWANIMRLKAKRTSSPVQLKKDGAYYYIWTFRDVSNLPTEISKAKYIENFMPDFSIVLDSEELTLYYGDRPISETSLGNSSYYVDNSIITLNSPEIELQEKTFNLSDTNFRILGIIPLTATASDISLQVDSPNIDTDLRGSGLIKRSYSNTNIGYHGFKGMVGGNAYLTNTEGVSYSMVQLSPWQSTGTLGLYPNTDNEFKTKDLLKQKILSNLRYSASTYFFPAYYTYINGEYTSTNTNNVASISSQVIGWKPSRGCFVQSFNGEDASSIIKLEDLNYTTKSLVYKGNIDTIALLTKGSSNAPIPNPIYSFKHNPAYPGQDSDSTIRINSPAASIYRDTTNDANTKYVKTSQGASIKYKSSPHFVVGFKCIDTLWGSQQKIQETLPTWKGINEEGIASLANTYNGTLNHGRLYEDSSVSSLYHQARICVDNLSIPTSEDGLEVYNLFRIQSSATNVKEVAPNYGWLWLGEIYREEDPTFGGTSEFALENNSWENASYKMDSIEKVSINNERDIYWKASSVDNNLDEDYAEEGFDDAEIEIDINKTEYPLHIQGWGYKEDDRVSLSLRFNINSVQQIIDVIEYNTLSTFKNIKVLLSINDESLGEKIIQYKIDKIEDKYSILFSFNPEDTVLYITWRLHNIFYKDWPKMTISYPILKWEIGDTYYQRFDTLKTYAYDDAAQNSIVDITSFMVETRVNIDGRYDRNRGQESNLQMSPTNFNLMNDVYSQRDNFFTYRILDDEVQARTKFPTQITWSLSKTAGATIDNWLNITLANVLDLDGVEGKLTSLKVFNNSIVAFQESGISQILFNSRVQIPTSEMVPIQIANSGKVDGQQFISRDIGCHHKYSITTSPLGIYFVDDNKRALYRFNGQLEDLSSSKGFRGFFYNNVTESDPTTLVYDSKNNEIMIHNPNFDWLGFSELTNTFSSFYVYPYAKLNNIKDRSIWLNEHHIFLHNEGEYNDTSLLTTDKWYCHYGIEVITRQDSNTIKTFNNVEFRADTYKDMLLDADIPFNEISIWTENDRGQSESLVYHAYKPSNLKKKLRTWKANIPRVSSSTYKKYVNQWAKIGLYKYNTSTEKTILHDLAVIYTD